MHPSLRFLFVGALATAGAHAALTPATTPADAPPTADQLEFFEKNIRPVLSAKCYKCHSAEAEKVKGGLLLDTREGTRQGGDTGHAVVPGNPGESLLLKALQWEDKDLRMPPEKSGGKLAPEVLANFERWISMGAPDPRDGAPPAGTRKKVDLEKGREFWAFQPPRAPALPAVRDTAWPRADLDRFILAAQEAQGLHPVADAEKSVLLRRAWFDLVGMPPSPEETEAFAQNKSPQAFASAVDRLLASPQFGERWGRHWLDVARFAESTGKERNYTYETAWRYRDYVIDATNADIPYDRFIREQIAGDLLPAATPENRKRQLIATGFLALGTKGLQEKNAEQFRVDLIDEQIDATTRAVLGLTVACARCHDHKFDPVPQKDYYALAGIFRSTDTLYGTNNSGGGKNLHPALLVDLEAAAVAEPAPPTEEEARLAELEQSNPRKAKRLRARMAVAAGAPVSDGKKAKTPLTGQTGADLCMGVKEGHPTNAHLLVRGEVAQPGDAVGRGFVNVLSVPAPAVPALASGRLELAQWLTSPQNPLTARVEVNRIWLHLFGQGLVRTADNFGAVGERPSHPELLDALTLQFIRDGWSVKKLIRSIMLSRTYALAGTIDPAANELDPDNRLLWHAGQRRLDAEEIRDAILTVSGRLQLKRPHGSVVANIPAGLVGKVLKPEVFTEVKAEYRSVYLPIVRDFTPEVLELFDLAEPSLVVAARDVTNVPSQALFLMNNKFVREQSLSFAQRILAGSADPAERLRQAYRLALGRLPTAAEQERAGKYLDTTTQSLMGSGAAPPEVRAWSTFCQALFACAEFRYLR